MSEAKVTRRSSRISTKQNVESKENIESSSHVTNKRVSSRKRSTMKVIEETNKTEIVKHSPPKQKKSSATLGPPPESAIVLLKRLTLDDYSSKPNQPKVSGSPPATVLLDRLSLDDYPSQPNQPKASGSKYAKAKKMLNNNETCNLPGREVELVKLSEFFENSLTNQKSASIYISGPPGTGKTSCVTKLLNESFADRFKEVVINCNAISTIGSIYKKICEQLKLKCGTEKENLSSIIKYITNKSQKKMVLLLLDEIDQLVGNKQSVLYTIFEWPAMINSRIVLVGIANALDLTDRLLTRLNTKCELKPKLLHFPSYTKEQIIDIFKSRLEDAGALDIFAPNTIQFLAAKVSAVSGDVRRALDIGRRVIDIAANKKKDENFDLEVEYLSEPEEKIKLQDVLNVLNCTYGSASKSFDDDSTQLPLQQKILVGTLLLILKNDKNKDITIGRSHAIYSKICSKRNIDALDQSEFAGMCALIEDRGIIKVIKHKEPKLRKIQLQWDESEVISALHDKELIASILTDSSCLGK